MADECDDVREWLKEHQEYKPAELLEMA